MLFYLIFLGLSFGTAGLIIELIRKRFNYFFFYYDFGYNYFIIMTLLFSVSILLKLALRGRCRLDLKVDFETCMLGGTKDDRLVPCSSNIMAKS